MYCEIATEIDSECCRKGFECDAELYCEPTCEDENEEFVYGLAVCPVTENNCQIYNYDKTSLCPEKLGRGCQCKEGYFKDFTLDKCRPLEECPPKPNPMRAVIVENKKIVTFDSARFKVPDTKCGDLKLSATCGKNLAPAAPEFGVYYQPKTYRSASNRMVSLHGGIVTIYFQFPGTDYITKLVVFQKNERRKNFVVAGSSILQDTEIYNQFYFDINRIKKPVKHNDLVVKKLNNRVVVYDTNRLMKIRIKANRVVMFLADSYRDQVCGLFGNHDDDDSDDISNALADDFNSNYYYNYCNMPDPNPSNTDEDCFNPSSASYSAALNNCQSKLSNFVDNCAAEDPASLIEDCAKFTCMRSSISDINTETCKFTQNVLFECLENLNITERAIPNCGINNFVCQNENTVPVKCSECQNNFNQTSQYCPGLLNNYESTLFQTELLGADGPCESSSRTCFMGCVCDAGYLFDGDNCVLPADCPDFTVPVDFELTGNPPTGCSIGVDWSFITGLDGQSVPLPPATDQCAYSLLNTCPEKTTNPIINDFKIILQGYNVYIHYKFTNIVLKYNYEINQFYARYNSDNDYDTFVEIHDPEIYMPVKDGFSFKNLRLIEGAGENKGVFSLGFENEFSVQFYNRDNRMSLTIYLPYNYVGQLCGLLDDYSRNNNFVESSVTTDHQRNICIDQPKIGESTCRSESAKQYAKSICKQDTVDDPKFNGCFNNDLYEICISQVCEAVNSGRNTEQGSFNRSWQQEFECQYQGSVFEYCQEKEKLERKEPYICDIGEHPTKTGVCYSPEAHVIGDPHFTSFDGFVNGLSFPTEHTVDYMGTCQYTYLKYCNDTAISDTVPWFHLIINQKQVADRNPKVSYTVAATIKYQPLNSDDMLEMLWDRDNGKNRMLIKINGGSWIPFENGAYPSFGLKKIFYQGRDYVYLAPESVGSKTWWEDTNTPPPAWKAKFTLKEFAVKVQLECDYKGKVCGLMGDYNDIEDPLQTPTGQIISTEGLARPDLKMKFKEFGDSWLYEDPYQPLDRDPCGQDVPDPFDFDKCQAEDLEKYAEYCEFRNYTSIGYNDCLMSDDKYNSLVLMCKLDLCAHQEYDQTVIDRIACEFRENYVSDCQASGSLVFSNWVDISDSSFGQPKLCEPKCPVNQEWVECRSNCVIDYNNCQIADQIKQNCDNSNCIAGCQCQEGFIFNGESCVAAERCPRQPNPDPNPEENLVCRGHASGYGDTHYKTFDGFVTDYQGNCQYQISKLCNSSLHFSPEMPYFSLVGRQQVRSDWHRNDVTFLHGWRFTYQTWDMENSITIRFDHNENDLKPRIRINSGEGENAENLHGDYVDLMSPHIYEEYGIITSGINGKTIYFGVNDPADLMPGNESPKNYLIKFEWNEKYFISMDLDCIYQEKICGLWGNFNQDQSDEWTLPSGEVLEIPKLKRKEAVWYFGNEWLVDTEYCEKDWEHIDEPDTCTESVRELAVSNEYCGKFFFEKPWTNCGCRDKRAMFSSCVYDLCHTAPDKWPAMLCDLLESFQQTCEASGVFIDSWRTDTFCPKTCSHPSLVYLENASGCAYNSRTCDPNSSFEDQLCNLPGKPGCVCPTDKPYWNGYKCIASCPELPPLPRPPTEKCTTPAFGRGDTHYHTFDGEVVDFQGNCQYKISGTCEERNVTANDDSPYFELIGRQQKRPGYHNQAVTFLYGWSFTWQPNSYSNFDGFVNINYDLLRENYKYPQISENNNNEVNLIGPYFYEDYQILVTDSSKRTIYFGIETAEQALNPDQFFKIKFEWNTKFAVYLTLDCAYQNQVCGLMGDYDNVRENDFATKEGVIQNNRRHLSHQNIGNSWLVGQETCPEDFVHVPIECTDEQRVQIESDEFCGKLNKEPFKVCDFGDMDAVLHDCVYDLCYTDPSTWTEQICELLEAREKQCNSNYKQIDPLFDWRTLYNCPLPSCPGNQVFSAAASGHTFSLWNCQADTPQLVQYPLPTIAGCQCPENLKYWDGYQCLSSCPPTKPWLPEPTPQCSATATGQGDTHYRSFDGLKTDFQGHCTYVLSEICQAPGYPGGNGTGWRNADLSEYGDGLVNFRIEARQQTKRPGQIVTYLHGWKIFYIVPNSPDNLEIIITWDYYENNQIPTIQVGADSNPVNLISPYFYEDLKIATEGSLGEIIYLGVNSTDPTDLLNYPVRWGWSKSHSMDMRLRCDYKNLVCGMLGTYDDDPTNDWMLPDGTISPTLTKKWFPTMRFGMAWGVEDYCPADEDSANNPPNECSAEQLEIIKTDQWCGQYNKEPWSRCQFEKQATYDACVYDLCLVDQDMWQETLCELSEYYAKTCQENKQFVPDSWREVSRCPLQCPFGLVPTDDKSSCEDDLLTNYNCRERYSEGYISTCPTPPTTGCVCPENKPIWNKSLKRCDAICPGIPDPPITPVDKCTSYAYGNGDTHYYTYDGHQYDYQGTCEYLLSGICNFNGTELVPQSTMPDGLPWFKLYGTQKYMYGVTHVSYLVSWRIRYIPAYSFDEIEIYYNQFENNMIPVMSINGGVKVNLNQNKYYEEYQIFTERNTVYLGVNPSSDNGQPNLLTDFLIKLKYKPGGHLVGLELDCDYKTLVCGMFGSFDDDQTNDLLDRDGEITEFNEYWLSRRNTGRKNWPYVVDSHEFASHWRVTDFEKPGQICETQPVNITSCTDEEFDLFLNSPDYCGALELEPFISCGIDTQKHKELCAFDLCKGGTNEENREILKCKYFADYAGICDDARKPVGQWQYPGFCAEDCGEKSGKVFMTDVSGCELTMDNCQRYDTGNNTYVINDCRIANENRCICPPEKPIFDSYNNKCIAKCENSHVDPGIPICYSNYAVTLKNSYMTFDKYIVTDNDNLCHNLLLSQTVHNARHLISYNLVFNPNTRNFDLTLFNGDDLPIKIDNNFDLQALNASNLYRFNFEYHEALHYRTLEISLVTTQNDRYDMKIGYFESVKELSLTLACTYRGQVEGIFGDYNRYRPDDQSNLSSALIDRFVLAPSENAVCEPKCPEGKYYFGKQCKKAYDNLYQGYDFSWKKAYRELFMKSCKSLCQTENLCSLKIPFHEIISGHLQWPDNYWPELKLKEACYPEFCGDNEIFIIDGPGTCVRDLSTCLNATIPCEFEPNQNVSKCYCAEGYVRGSNGECVHSDVCIVEQPIKLNVGKPCCEKNVIPQERPPKVGNVKFDRGFKLNVPKPCCENDHIPPERPSNVGNVIFERPDTDTIILNTPKPCCETTLPPDYPEKITSVTFKFEDKDIKLDIPKPCCENTVPPDFKKPGKIIFAKPKDKVFIMDIPRPCCENIRPPDYKKPGTIKFDKSWNIGLDIQKPCCETTLPPDYKEPGNFTFIEETFDYDLNVPKPCCETTLPPDYKTPINVIFDKGLVKNITLDIQKPCCESTKPPDYVTPPNIDLDLIFDFELDLQQPCCEHPGVMPDYVEPGQLNLTSAGIALDIQKPCCETTRPPDYQIPGEFVFTPIDITLNVEKPCCESTTPPDYQLPPNITLIFTEPQANFTFDIKQPCCELDLPPDYQVPAKINFTYPDFSLNVEKPCCEHKNIPTLEPISITDVIFDWTSFTYDIEKPCCEHTDFPEEIDQYPSDIIFEFDDFGLDVEKPCCEFEHMPTEKSSTHEDIYLIYDDSETIELDIQKPCCENPDLPISLDIIEGLDIADIPKEIIFTYDYSEELAGIDKSHVCCLDSTPSQSEQHAPCQDIDIYHDQAFLDSNYDTDYNALYAACQKSKDARRVAKRSVADQMSKPTTPEDAILPIFDWSPCSATCGFGISTRISESGVIDLKSCKVRDCDSLQNQISSVSQWSDWDNCELDPITERTYQTRKRFTRFGNDTEIQTRNDCAYQSEWTEWQSCEGSAKFTTRRRKGYNIKDKIEVQFCDRFLNSENKQQQTTTTKKQRVKPFTSVIDWKTNATDKIFGVFKNKEFEYQIYLGNYSHPQANTLCNGDFVKIPDDWNSDATTSQNKDLNNLIRSINEKKSGSAISENIITIWGSQLPNNNNECELHEFKPINAYTLQGNYNVTNTHIEFKTKTVPCRGGYWNYDGESYSSQNYENQIICAKPIKPIEHQAWDTWSKCSKSCDVGMQYRSIKDPITKETKYQSRVCNVQPCDAGCIEKDNNYLVEGSYQSEIKKMECKKLNVAVDCKHYRAKLDCPITCKRPGCERYWKKSGLQDHQEFKDFAYQIKDRFGRL